MKTALIFDLEKEFKLQKTTRIRLADVISNIFSPFLITAVTIFLLAFRSELEPAAAFRWAVFVAVICILPIITALAWLVKAGKLDSLFASIRQQRTEIYVIAIAFTATDYVVLRYMNAPSIFMAALGTALLGLAVFMCINFWWKISLHTAFVGAMVTILAILYGWWGLFALPLVFILGWARVTLKEHTLAQVSAGAAVAGVLALVGFNLFGFL